MGCLKKKTLRITKKFRPYQKDAFKLLLLNKFFALYMEMRLGKTFVLVKRIKLFMKKKDLILIVCPYSAFNSWRDEFNELGHLICEVVGERQERLQILADNWDKYNIFITNKEAHKRLPEIKDIPWKCLILDEAHFIKNPKALVTKFFLKHFGHVEYRYILTGTPIGNSYLDYFCQLKFLLYSLLNESTYYHFKKRYFIQLAYKAFITKDGKQYLANLLKKYSFVLTRKQAGLENKPIEIIREIRFDTTTLEMYNMALNDWVFEYQQERKLTKWILVQFHWLRRICGGVLPDGKIIHELKFEELYELLQGELLNKRAIIWCRYTDEIIALYKYLTKLGFKVEYIIGKVKIPERERIVKEFNEGKFQLLAAQPLCLKEGTDLSGVDISIYYSLPDGHVTKDQVDARINSIVKFNGLLIIYLMIVNSVDFKILKGLKKQTNYSNILLDYVKELSYG